MHMDMSSLSSMASSVTTDRIGVAVARKAQDAMRNEGEAMVEMIRDAANIVSESGGGASTSNSGGAGSLDVYA